MGLTKDWAYQIIKHVGNYAEIYEKHVGPSTPIGLARGLNALWRTAASSTLRRSAKTNSDPALQAAPGLLLRRRRTRWLGTSDFSGQGESRAQWHRWIQLRGTAPNGLLPQRSRHPRHHLPGRRRGPDRRLLRLARRQHRGQPRGPEQDHRLRLPVEDRRLRHQLHAVPLEPHLLLLGGVPRRHHQHASSSPFIGIVFATIIGFTLGIARLSSNFLISRLATIYVETIRNIPLLLQLFFWYFAVLKAMPAVKQTRSSCRSTSSSTSAASSFPSRCRRPSVRLGLGRRLSIAIVGRLRHPPLGQAAARSRPASASRSSSTSLAVIVVLADARLVRHRARPSRSIRRSSTASTSAAASTCRPSSSRCSSASRSTRRPSSPRPCAAASRPSATARPKRPSRSASRKATGCGSSSSRRRCASSSRR